MVLISDKIFDKICGKIEKFMLKSSMKNVIVDVRKGAADCRRSHLSYWLQKATATLLARKGGCFSVSYLF